jgi:very-long-chain ceramide synthase
MKGYILAQWAFWLQQIMVINIEERRKDHWQMLSHHFITSALISACYSYHHTRVGTLILVLMDVGDLQLGVSPFPPASRLNGVCMMTDLSLACQVPKVRRLHECL